MNPEPKSCNRCTHWLPDHYDCAGRHVPVAPVGWCQASEQMTYPSGGQRGALHGGENCSDFSPAPATASEPISPSV